MEIKIKQEYTGQNLLDHLRKNNINISAPCSGKGLCKKCRVRISSYSDPLPISDTEKSVFSEAELEEGYRLACLQTIRGKMTVELSCEENDMLIETSFSADSSDEKLQNKDSCSDANTDSAIIAIDIGTTTLAAALLDTRNKKAAATAGAVNHQRRFGADVISRIEASNNGNGALLMRSIRSDIKALTKNLGVSSKKVSYIISGNTTMQHLLLGYSCKTLGVAPYTPVNISLHTQGDLTLLPGISTFVGADIVSGIIACGMDISDKICLLVDLGTNGEMAIGNKDKLLVTSTAAGPAFEGGNISCGTAGIPGAIDSVVIENGRAHITTIAKKTPVGICGTGVLETVYELVKNDIADETGLLSDEYFESGFPLADNILFTQKDVREVQLAKAAIRAGIETLISSYGISCSDISALYIAGGFGKKINIEKAAGIGLIPPELISKASACGNSSLEGAIVYGSSPDDRKRFTRVPEISKELLLAESSSFTQNYMNAMYFE